MPFRPFVLLALIAPLTTAASPAATAQPPSTLAVDGEAVPPGVELVVLGGAGPVRVELADPPARADSYALAPSVPGPNATVAVTRTTATEWRASSGSLAPLSSGGALWTPAEEGRPAQIAVRASTHTNHAGTPSGEETADSEALIYLLPPVGYDPRGDGTVGGTMIGYYPDERAEGVPAVVARNPAAYSPPRLFHRLDANTKTLITGGETPLGTFHPSPFPDAEVRYVVVSPGAAEFWAAMRGAVENHGLDPGALRVLRGFVSPAERQRLERSGVAIAEFSRHLYGDALAVVYDPGGDGRFNDVDGDGAVDGDDLRIVADLARDALRAAGLSGGVGVERDFRSPDGSHGPYVHVDWRGWDLRWDTLP